MSGLNPAQSICMGSSYVVDGDNIAGAKFFGTISNSHRFLSMFKKSVIAMNNLSNQVNASNSGSFLDDLKLPTSP